MRLVCGHLMPQTTPASHSGGDGGRDQLRSRLVGQDGKPMIYCFATHVVSTRTIPALQHVRRDPRL